MAHPGQQSLRTTRGGDPAHARTVSCRLTTTVRTLSNTPGLPRLPAPLLIAALLYWGWQQHQLMLAAVLAAVIAAAVASPWRWPFQTRDCHRVCDLSGLILIGFALLSFRDFGLAQGFLRTFSWLPLLLFLLPLTQTLRAPQTLPLASLFAGLRHRERDATVPCPYGEADIGYPYLIICLLAAGCGREPDAGAAVVGSALIVLSLWPARRYNPGMLAWPLAMLCALGMAQAATGGLRTMHESLEPIFIALFDEYFWRNRDPLINRTSLGSVVGFKRSERILARIHTAPRQRIPALLREASYSTFQYGNWLARDGAFLTVEPQRGDAGKTWVLGPGPPADERTQISIRFRKHTATVPVPLGARQIERVDAAEVQQNPFGAVRLELHPGWVSYQVAHRAYWSGGDPPRAPDREVPPEHRPDLERFATQLGLYGLAPREAIRRTNTYFIQHFRYSIQRRWPRDHSRLHDFLFRNRSGHCEYFATATTLLLRELGIPTRYSVGYAVREYSPLGTALHRARAPCPRLDHGLAGRTLGTHRPDAPSLWAEEETEFALRPMLDMFSLLGFWISPEAGIRDELPWLNRLLTLLLLPLLALLAYSLLRRPRIARADSPYRPTPGIPGADSEFYRALRHLERRYGTRPAGVPLARWLARYHAHRGTLATMLRLHYGLRFDPAGLPRADRHRPATPGRCLGGPPCPDGPGWSRLARIVRPAAPCAPSASITGRTTSIRFAHDTAHSSGRLLQSGESFCESKGCRKLPAFFKALYEQCGPVGKAAHYTGFHLPRANRSRGTHGLSC